jgi:uncharacterized membrane protein
VLPKQHEFRALVSGWPGAAGLGLTAVVTTILIYSGLTNQVAVDARGLVVVVAMVAAAGI